MRQIPIFWSSLLALVLEGLPLRLLRVAYRYADDFFYPDFAPCKSTSGTSAGADFRMCALCPPLYCCFYLLKCYPCFRAKP